MCKQLVDDLKEKIECWGLKKETLCLTVWRTRFVYKVSNDGYCFCVLVPSVIVFVYSFLQLLFLFTRSFSYCFCLLVPSVIVFVYSFLQLLFLCTRSFSHCFCVLVPSVIVFVYSFLQLLFLCTRSFSYCFCVLVPSAKDFLSENCFRVSVTPVCKVPVSICVTSHERDNSL
jgi:hypothetical protein